MKYNPYSSISEIREGISTGKVSAEEVVSQSLSRAEELKELNAFTDINRSETLKKVEDLDPSTPLSGIPIAVKDMILTKGLSSSAGSRILKGYKPPYQATVVSRLEKAGAVVMGKTNMDEFGMGSSNENSPFGPVQNPWNTELVPGGSSGGSAAAVAAGIVPAALGTDTGGSTRQPASLCGIVGLKPTYGRFSRYGVIAYASSLDQVGVFARSAKDCSLLYSVMAGHDPLDSTSVDIEVEPPLEQPKSSLKGLRIGVPKEYFTEGINGEVEDSVRKGIAQLKELGAEVVEISLPHTEYAVSTYYIVAPAEASSNLSRYDGVRYGHRATEAKELQEMYTKTRSEGFGTEVKRRILVGSYVLSSGYYDAYYRRAQKVRRLIAKDFLDAFETKCDLIACPTAPTTAFKIGEKIDDPVAMYLNDIVTVPISLAGLPAMSIPCGFDSNDLPIGLQLIGKPWGEKDILETAHSYQSATEWHKKHPNLKTKEGE